ncbi:MAG: 50S ribosomal protein L13 [Tenericutes bacterium HGW-Tenericutes-4]|jgi:large subunit ribosomal protein L13|nr:MAG: 50S ribosomal protein L13 [Tenericutes bacterium HGW-Tenericutes-4]
MKTYFANPQTVERKWHVIDATGVALGRVSTEAAVLLSGKHKPTYTPHVDTGDYVIVINADKAVLTGNKLEQKMYRTHSGYVGHLKETNYKTMMETKSDVVMEKSIKGMLPKNSLGKKMGGKLFVYKGENHPHQAQQPQSYTLKGVR